MDIDRSFKQGDIVKVRIINDGNGLHPMQHPIHFHGQRFLILNKNGVKNDNLVWKDTVLTLPGEYTDILIDMSNP
jgi:suppressor of ftsI